jgi:hypothetical protein
MWLGRCCIAVIHVGCLVMIWTASRTRNENDIDFRQEYGRLGNEWILSQGTLLSVRSDRPTRYMSGDIMICLGRQGKLVSDMKFCRIADVEICPRN